MSKKSVPSAQVGTWKSETASWHGSGDYFQRLRLLQHRLSEQGVPGSRQKRSAGHVERGKIGGSEGNWWQKRTCKIANRLAQQTKKGVGRMTKLICRECRHENESERIYCHSCGARLDRSAVAAQKSGPEGAKKAHRRLQKMLDPHRGKLRRMLFTIIKLMLAACIAAALAQMILPPEVAPPLKTVGLTAQINFDLENAALYHRPPQLQYTEDQVNAYLGYALKSKQNALNKPLLTFKRAMVTFREG